MRIARARAPELVAGAIALSVGLISSSLKAALAAFIVAALALEVTLDARDRMLRRSLDRFMPLVRARMRDAGIISGPLGGGDGLLDTPVLVSWHSFPRHDVFDQAGRLLAVRTGANQRSIVRLLNSPRFTYVDSANQPIGEVRSVEKAFAMLAADGAELGRVITAGREKGTIRSAGKPIGKLERTSRRSRILRGGPQFSILDADSREVGRLTHYRRVAFWNFVEIDQEMGVQLRSVLLAADAAVAHWTTPRGRG